MIKARCTRRRFGATALLLLPVVGACQEDGIAPPLDQEPAMMSVYLKDAPGDVDSVWVQINDIVLVGDGGQTSILSSPTALVNLTSLRDSSAALAEDVPVDTATVHEVRLVLGGAVLQAANGEVYTMGGAEHPHGMSSTGELKCPSCAQSGIKVKLSGDIEVSGGSNGLLLDFDVSQSFGHQAGHSGKWVMHPVIHAAEAEPDDIEDGDATGAIQGMVVLGTDENGDTVAIPACGDTTHTLAAFVPTATATTLTDDEGNPFMFTGETEDEDEGYTFEIDVTHFDTYALSYVAETEFTTDKLVWEALVTPDSAIVAEGANEVSGVVYTVTSATCVAVSP